MIATGDYLYPAIADALLMLEHEKRAISRNNFIENSLDISEAEETCNGLQDDTTEDAEKTGRDYLEEMELKTRVMITGSDPKEEAQIHLTTAVSW